MKKYIDYPTFESNIKAFGATSAKLDVIYNHSDHRCWSAVVDPGKSNIIVTFTLNKGDHGTYYFDIITQDRTSMDIYVDDIYDIISDLVGHQPIQLDELNLQYS